MPSWGRPGIGIPITKETNARIPARIRTKKSSQRSIVPLSRRITAAAPKNLGSPKGPNPGYNEAMFTSLAVVVLAGLLGPLLAAGRRPRIPVLVGELIGGILLGRTGLHLVDPTPPPFPAFSALGFAMLMLESGTEIDLGSKLLRYSAVRAGLAFLGTLLVAVPAGPPLRAWGGSTHVALFVVLLAGSSAAVALPTIRE